MSVLTLEELWQQFIEGKPSSPFQTLLNDINPTVKDWLSKESAKLDQVSTSELHTMYNAIRKTCQSKTITNKRLHSLFSLFIIFLNETHGLEIEVLPVIVVPLREKNVSKVHFSRASALVLQWWQAHYLPLLNEDTEKFNLMSNHKLLKLTAVSLAINASLAHPKYLFLFLREFLLNALQISRIGQRVYADIRAKKGQIKRHPTNAIIEQEAVHLRRVFFDAISLSLLARIRERLSQESHKSEFDSALKTVSLNHEIQFRSVLMLDREESMFLSGLSEKQLMQGLMRVFNHQLGYTIPPTMLHNLNDDRTSLCCDHKSFLSLFTGIRPTMQEITLELPVSCESEEDYLIVPTEHVDAYVLPNRCDMSQAIGIVRRILSTSPYSQGFSIKSTNRIYTFGYDTKEDEQTDKAIHKQKKEIIIEQLTRVLEIFRAESRAFELILEWYLYHLTILENKASTVTTYNSTIFRQWMRYAHQLNLDAMSADAFYEMYLSIVIDAHEQRRGNLADKLLQFHQYLSDRQNIKPLEQNQIKALKTFENQIHVKSSLVCENLFTEILDKLENSQELTSFEKLKAKVILILAYRVGLRITEILSIQVKELQPENDFWVVIRNNAFASLKSQASYRSGTIGILCPEKEKMMLHNYTKIILSNPVLAKKSLLFSNSESPIKPVFLNEKIKSVGSRYDLYVTLHSLRHTAVNRLYMLLRNTLPLIPYLNLYSYEQISTIQDYFLGSASRTHSISWQVASFAGHRSPDMTYSSYLHLNQFLLSTYLNHYDVELTRNAIMNIAQVNHQTAMHILGKSKSLIYERLLSESIKITDPYCLNLTEKGSKKYYNQLNHPYCETVFEFEKRLDLRKFASTFKSMFSYETESKALKFLSDYRLDKSQAANLVDELKAMGFSCFPKEALENDEDMLLTQLVAKFDLKFKTNAFSSKLKKLMMLYISSKVKNKSYLHFTCPSDVIFLISNLFPQINYRDWRITLKIPNQSAKNLWDEVLGEISDQAEFSITTGNTRHKNGLLKLQLKHPKESEWIAKYASTQQKIAFSSSVLHYFFYYLYVLYRVDVAPGELE